MKIEIESQQLNNWFATLKNIKRKIASDGRIHINDKKALLAMVGRLNKEMFQHLQIEMNIGDRGWHQ